MIQKFRESSDFSNELISRVDFLTMIVKVVDHSVEKREILSH